MGKHLAWMAVVALVAALAGQYVVYRSAVPVATGHASWNFAPKNFADVTKKAKHVVEASVVSVEAGPPIVTAQSGEPGGSDVIPTQRITM